MLKKSSINELLIKAARSLKNPPNLRNRILKKISEFQKTTGEYPNKMCFTQEQWEDIFQHADPNMDYNNGIGITLFGIPIEKSNRFKIS